MSHRLTEDFWSEILQWLPVKSLVRLRCVSRSWNSLISSPSFIARHLSCSSTKPRMFASCIAPNRLGKIYLALDYDESDATYIPRFDMELIEKKYGSREIVGTVNGVICLSTYKEQVFCPNYALWNPVIHKYIKLPWNRVHVRYVYPHSWSGFGFKASEDDFRVLFVCCKDPGYERDEDDLRVGAKFRVRICSVRRRTWRNLPAEILSQCIVPNPDSRCLMNGVLHLPAFNGAETLLLFDFEREMFSFMALPKRVSSNVDVAVYKGKLAALDYDCRKNVPTCRIWSMSEYGDPASWVCVIGVYLSPLSRTLIPIKERIAGLTADGKIIIGRENRVFILRDPARRKRRWLGMKYPIRKIYACGFVESLVFLDRESRASSLPLDDLSKGLYGNLSNTVNAASDRNFTNVKYQHMDECAKDFEDEDDEGFEVKGDEDEEVESDEDEEVESDDDEDVESDKDEEVESDDDEDV